MTDFALTPYAYPTAYYALKLDYFQMEHHRHNQWEIMYLVSGICLVEVEGMPVTMNERQFIAIPPGIPHRLEVNRGDSCSLLNFEFSCSRKKGGTNLVHLAEISEAFARLMKSEEPYILLADNGKMEFALKDLIQELEQYRKNSYLLDLIFQRMLIEWSRCMENSEHTAGIAYVKKAQAYIQEHFADELKVADIAQLVGLNHSYLQTLFKKSLGCGIMEYINSQRMERAAFLLKNSSMTVSDITFEVGFNSRQHFGYTFEKRFQISPKQYRTLHGQQIQADTKKGQKFVKENGEFARYWRLTD